MNERSTRIKTVSLVVSFALLATILVPIAEAQSQMNVRSVGEFFVDAAGRASGQNVATGIFETSGALSAFTSLALGAEIFSGVNIDGFAQAQKIQGVGSSSLVLRGSNAIVSVYDNIASVVKIEATAATTIHYDVSTQVHAVYEAETRHVVDLYAESGAYLGSVILVGAEGAASAAEQLVITAQGDIKANVEAGTSVVFRAKPVYVSSEAYNEAVVNAAAKGYLAAEFVTEFSAKGEAQSKVEYAQATEARLLARGEGYLQTEVRSRTEAAAIVSYDLAYESIPADTANDVAVYVDGQLAARANTAAEVMAYAEAGIAAYYAAKASGRTEVLASTPAFQGEASHFIAITATGDAAARTEAQAIAEAKARLNAAVGGVFNLYGEGKLAGRFTSTLLVEGKAAIKSYTTLEGQTQVFDNVEIKNDQRTNVQGQGTGVVTVNGNSASLVMVDDIYASLLVEARARAEAFFDLGADVRATYVNENLIRLDGPNAYAGFLIIAEAQANGQVEGGSKFVTDAQGNVHAMLESQSKVVFRSEAKAQAQAHASEEVVAHAIAKGQVAAQVLAGFKGEAIATSEVAMSAAAQVQVLAAKKGDFTLEHESRTEAATVVVFDTRGTALAAKAASDIQVYVNGQAAAALGSAQAVIDAKGRATYYVENSLQGAVRVIVNTNAQANVESKINIVSSLEAKAKAASKTDAFGAFKMFYDGTAVGNFVSLKTDATAGVVSGFTMQSTGQQVFSSIKAGASAFVSAGAEGASVLRLENREQKLEVADTTSAYMKIVAKAQSETAFKLAADIQAKVRGDAVVELTGKGGYLGSLIITDVEGKAASSSRFVASAQGEVQAKLQAGAQIIFRTHVGIETELSAAQRTMMNQAIASGKVAGQVVVQTQAALAAQAYAAAQAKAKIETNAKADASGYVAAASEASGRVTTAITTSYYSDVQMVSAATLNRVDVTVSSASHVGKTVIVSLDPETVKGLAAGNAEILVDGKVVAQASSYADILNAADDNGADEYFVLAGEAGTQVLVSFAHFSTRTVTLKEADTSSTPLYMYATIFLGLLVVAETVIIARQKMRSS